MNSWMVYGPFSLAQYGISDADFSFEFKLACEEGYDQFFAGASIDGINYYGVNWDGFHEEFYDFDLTDVYELGNLLGESQVWIAFVFKSDGSFGEIEGAQVDDVTIWKNISSALTDPYEPNNSFSNAQPMNLEFDIDDALISPILDVDFFKIPISDLGTITITLSSLPADYDLYFYDPNQNQIAYSTYGGTSPEQIVFSDFGMSGYYYIKVYGYEGAFNSFETYHLSTQWESLAEPDIQINPTNLTIIQDSKQPLINRGLIQNTNNSDSDGTTYFGLGGKIKQEDIEYWKNRIVPDYPSDPSITSIDWSVNDSPVKNQGTCGSCWAFAATAYIENLGMQEDLSEQVVLSCVTSGDCTGGYFSDALLYFKNTGVPGEGCYPYIEDDGNCNDKCDDPNFLEKITSVSNQLWGSSTTVSNIKSKLNEGPLVVRMLVPTDNTFNGYPGYQGGIYNYNGGPIPNTQGHAVLIVGYDDGQQCFKVKNSWGTGWGEEGYFRIAYDDVTDDVQFGTYARNGSGVFTEWQNGDDSFTISNVGDGVLTINSISDNMNWLLTSEYPSTPFDINPGGSQQVDVTVNWSLLGSTSETGIVSISCNDPDEPTVTVSVTAIPEQLPDLVVENQSINPSSVFAGETISSSCIVKNQGNGSADNSELRYYLSVDQYWDGSDIELGNDYVSSLSPGETSSESENITIPTSTQAGTYYILFYVDADLEVNESNEDNNVSYSQITILTPSITLNPTFKNVGALAGSTSVSVSSNVIWEVSENCDWITCNPTGGSNNGNFSVNYGENTSSGSRSCTISIDGNGASATFTLMQEGSNLEISGCPSDDVSNNSGNFNLIVNSNITWNVSESCDWVTCSASNGSGDGSITISYEQNTSSYLRSCEITISGGGQTETCYFTQEGSIIEISGCPSQNVSQDAGSFNVNVSSNLSWNVSETCDWVTCNPSAGNGNDNISVVYVENPYAGVRCCTITISGSGLSEDCYFCQEGTVGITENAKDNEIVIYPNPANNQIIIQNNGMQNIKSVVFMDALGKIVHQMDPIIKSSEIEISSGNFKTGIYQIKIMTEDNTFYKKLIIQH